VLHALCPLFASIDTTFLFLYARLNLALFTLSQVLNYDLPAEHGVFFLACGWYTTFTGRSHYYFAGPFEALLFLYRRWEPTGPGGIKVAVKSI